MSLPEQQKRIGHILGTALHGATITGSQSLVIESLQAALMLCMAGDWLQPIAISRQAHS